MSLSLLQKKSLRDFEPKRVQYLGELKALTGIDFEVLVEPSMEVFVGKLNAANATAADKIGDCLYGDNGYLLHVLKFFRKQWGDELVREALVGACSAKKIVLRESDSWDPMDFSGGVLFINTTLSQCWLFMDRVENFDPASKL